MNQLLGVRQSLQDIAGTDFSGLAKSLERRMPFFSYVAVDKAGKQIKAVMEADNESLVLQHLRAESLQVLELKQTRGKAKIAKGKMKPKALVVFSRQFATMIDAGIPILRCLDILVGQTKDPILKPVLEQIRNDVKGGLTLNEAMAKHPSVFSKLYLNMIKAAELGGIL
ncbi:MAG: type II secretion system F family protein, partial [Chthonomonadaceae bacterium]|nr:type II secretion system F family protein [Chthonomonadaceae bacterium]